MKTIYKGGNQNGSRKNLEGVVLERSECSSKEVSTVAEKWKMVKEIQEGEFRIRKEDGKCFLERRVTPINVTDECTTDFHMGPFSYPGAYIRVLHRGKVIGMVRFSNVEVKDPSYEFKSNYPDNYSFQIVKTS